MIFFGFGFLYIACVGFRAVRWRLASEEYINEVPAVRAMVWVGYGVTQLLLGGFLAMAAITMAGWL